MSSQLSKWKEEQILIICPGSRTTMAQLGCGELTPPAYRIPTRMFRDEETGEWRPYRTWKRKKQQQQQLIAANSDGGADGAAKEGDEWEYVEDPDSDEGAVYPMEGGYIVNMDAFLAFLEHVHGLLTTTYHNTPIVLMTSSQWTRPDCETIALYIFEKTRTPALCMINSALATQYGLKWSHMTVIDIGFEKVDVTCIYDSRIVNHMEVGYAGEPGDNRTISGGEVFTQRLRSMLRDKSFTHEMAEQLKKSNLCEVLPYAPDQPRLMVLPEDDATSGNTARAPGPAAVFAAAAGTDEPPAAQASSSGALDTADDAGLDDGAVPVAEDGVLDVATIVTSGQTKEFLAKKDKERSERGRFGRRGKDKEAEAAAAKPVRLPNAKRARMTFHFEELIEQEDAAQPTSNGYSHQASNGSALGAASGNGAAQGANGKSHDEEADGSEDGSEGEGSEMDEDEDEEGEGEGEGDEGEAETEGAPKTDKASTDKPEDSAGAQEADKPKEESAASTAVKAEDTLAAQDGAAAAAAGGADKAQAAEQPSEDKPSEAASATTTTTNTPEKPKELEAPSAASDAAAATSAPAAGSDDKPTTPKAAMTEDATMEDASAAKEGAAEATATKTDAPSDDAAAPAPTSTELVPATPTSNNAVAVAAAAPAPAVAEPQGRRYKRQRRDFEIGIERFTFADRYEIDRIVTTIYRAVQGIEEMYMRPPCWENLVFVGNGCRLRGLRENILQTLSARHLISPSTATMFTSELPSNMGTPSGTGSQTPTGNFNTPPHQLPTSSSVNPLLQAATTASLAGAPPHGGANTGTSTGTGGPGSAAGGDAGGGAHHSHHFHSQTPTTIKLATLPTYLGEWTKNGFEEAMFLGAQVAARLAFCVHNLDAIGQESQRQMSLTRVDYNELGPKGIRTHAMLG